MSGFYSPMAIENDTSFNESKIKELLSAIENYLNFRTESSANTVSMHLQHLSVTIDKSMFDPHLTIVSQLFHGLYELMGKIDQGSTFSWYCVDVLSNACRNSAARNALMDTYNFIPSLSKLLNNELTVDKKIRLLRLLQDLTSGIKISWQIPHLPQLIVILCKWIENQDDKVITLALAVLVNLCYKNLPAIYILYGYVDTKHLINICLRMEGPIRELHTCKLLVNLDYMNNDIPNNILMKLIYTTFKSINEAYIGNDSIVLREIVDFFYDISHKYSIERLANYQYYDEHLTALFQVIENDVESGENNHECIGFVFKFLHTLTEIDLDIMMKYYLKLIDLSLKWIGNNSTSSQALNLLTIIAIKINNRNNNCYNENDDVIFDPLIKVLPVFLTILNNNDNNINESISINNEYYCKINGILQLLKAMSNSNKLRPILIDEIDNEVILKLFKPLINDEIKRALTTDEINLFIYAIALINELAKYNIKWMALQNNLMGEKHLQIVLAQALCTSSKEVKTIIFEIATTASFPRQIVAESMSSILSNYSAQSQTTTKSELGNEMNFTTLPLAKIERIDDLLEKLKNLNNPSLSDIMELYEYRINSISYSERMTTVSLEAANDRCIQLQHRITQLTSELNRFHQSLFHSQQSYEKLIKSKDLLNDNIKQLKNQLDSEKGKYKVLENQLKNQQIETTKKLNELNENNQQLDEQNSNLKQAVHRLEENSTRLEQVIQKKEEIIKQTNHNIESLNLQINELNLNLKQKEVELQNTKNEVKTITKELIARKQTLETITKVVSSQY